MSGFGGSFSISMLVASFSSEGVALSGEDERLRKLYDEVWAGGAAAFRGGTYRADPVPAHGAGRWGLSFVVRVEGALAEAFAAECDRIARVRRSPHLVYRRDELHMTVRSLEGYQETVPEEQVLHYRSQLERAVEGVGPFAVRFRGLCGSPAGVFVRGYPDGALFELRHRLTEAQRPQGNLGVPGGDGERVRDNAHVSLLVAKSPVVAEPELVEYVDARSEVEFGTLRCAAVALVRYRPDAVSVGLEEYERIRLG
ncbi:2'-5' RNA ligase family protein [Glycomyces tenuis]|uniref:2'-5' RNA ligase family protein n=1 Tax=Glycomyces tenuis TaxID=58116 RepID=UPI0012DF6552|nr:hypothetical protein [Glycomyces tenuis]